jgi:hypothetical protein
MATFQPEHDSIVAYLQQHPPDDNSDRVVARTFDERDLVDYFIATGFRDVELNYRYRYTSDVAGARQVMAKRVQDTPGYAAAARAVLGAAAEAYLARLIKVLSATPFPSAYTQAYVLATR